MSLIKPVFGNDGSNFLSNYHPMSPAVFRVVGWVEWRLHCSHGVVPPWAGPRVYIQMAPGST